MRFSERKGFKQVSTLIQRDTLSQETRNLLWNHLHANIWDVSQFHNPYSDCNEVAFGITMWHHFYRLPLDDKPGIQAIIKKIRGEFFNGPPYAVYDLLEFILGFWNKSELNDSINSVLAEELVAYRYVGGQITDITDEAEVEMLQIAMNDDVFPYVKAHLESALAYLSNRKSPDYRNSIKESISAVESLAKEITGKPKAELGEALGILEKKGKLHGALKVSFAALYGYTSNANGIRHALMEEPALTADEAKFFLLSCTSFINYLKTKI
jgi:hypothetical protein